MCWSITRHVLSTIVALACFNASETKSFATSPDTPRLSEANTGFRRPQDIITVGQHLVVACQTPPSLVVLDAFSGEQECSSPFDGMPVKLLPLADEQWIVVDQANHRLAWYRFDSRQVKEVRSIACIQDPLDVAMTNQGLIVSGRWSRQVACYAPSKPWQHDYRELWKTDLNFAPGCIHELGSEKLLIVADYYGCQWATLNIENGKEKFRHQFFGHRMRGFIEDPQGYLVVSHQLLNATSRTVKEDLHWGITLSNDVRWLRRDHVTSDQPQAFFRDSRIDRIGEVGNGSAEPNDLCVASDGTVVVVCGGTNEVAIGKLSDFALQRTTVDFNPVAVTLSPDEQTAWIACRFDHSVVAVNMNTRRVEQRIALGKTRELTSAERGEQLFHDATLSHDGWMTCASCHPDGHTIQDRSDNLSDGDYGSPKRIPSLLGRAGTSPYGWLGTDEQLGAQLRRSIRHTMQSDRTLSDLDVADLIAYLQSLPPPPPIAAVRNQWDQKQIDAGRAVFKQRNCAECHQSPNFTSNDLHDVGTSDSGGRHAFNPPSLIGVSQAGPGYLHDGRAISLREVFSKHHHPYGNAQGKREPISEEELTALLKYLESL